MRAKARTVLLFIFILRTQVSTQNNHLLAKFMNRQVTGLVMELAGQPLWQLQVMGGYTHGPAEATTLNPST